MNERAHNKGSQYAPFGCRTQLKLCRCCERYSSKDGSSIGAKNVAYFYPICSNRIYHQNPDDPRFIRLKAGTLDDASKLEPDAHCWIQSAPKWVRLPEDALVYETQPSIEEGLLAIKVRRKKAVNTYEPICCQ